MTRDALPGLLALLLTTGLVSAQSLGDVARQEEVRRKAAAPAGKVYTNGDLKDAPAPALLPPAPLGAAPSAPDAKTETKGDAKPAAGDGKTDTKAEAKPADGKQDEAAWRKRKQTLQESLDRSKTFAEALQSRINGLTADFAARDDPAQRNAVGADRQRSLTELDRVKKEIQQFTDALAALQDEARKSGVPAGWVR